MAKIDFFKDYKKIGKKIKKIVEKRVKAEIYFFGSIVKGNYSKGLSDIDIAIVSDEFKDRKKKLKLYDILFEKFFDSPLEFHFLTKKQWKYFRRFIGKDFEKLN